MSMIHWLSNQLCASPLRALRKRPVFRPMLETLERRELMSASAIGYLGGGNSAVLATVTNTSVTLATPGRAVVPGSPVYPSEPIIPVGPASGMIHAIGSQIIT
jgi:hypothetical protein